KPAALSALKSLPADYNMFIGFEFGSEAYNSFHPIMKALAASAGGDEDENKDAAKAISEALDELLAAKPRRYLSASKASGEEELHVWEFTDPAKGAAADLKLFRALKVGSEYQFRTLKEKPLIKAESQKYRDTKLHYVSMKWDLDKLIENFPGGEEAAKGLLKTL